MKLPENRARVFGIPAMVLAACLAPGPSAPAGESPPQVTGLSWQSDSGMVALLKDGKPVWRFNHAPTFSKPNFSPVALPGGTDLSWLSPPDHRWHLALFFSWKYLNKVNYWEETAGVANGGTKWTDVKIETKKDFSAIIAMNLQYRPQKETKDVLTEHRLMRVTPPAKDGTYFMDWQQEFTAGDQDVVMDRTPPDTKPDGNARGGYAGLSVRLAKELQNPRITATADIGTLQRSRYGFAATAAEFGGEIDGGEAGIAFLDHPDNLRAPTRWYGIIDPKVPFWYLNASLLQLEPYTLPAHKKLILRYRVAVHPGRWDGARLAAERLRYAKGGD